MSIFTVLCLLAFSNAWAARYYVQLNATGDGSSWASPLGDLQAALSLAVADDQIWVAAGTYFPAADGDRTASFVVPNKVKIYGGFNGTETALAQRNWQLNQTTLSGDLGIANDNNDNSYTILYFNGVNEATLIDGFFITDGAANGFVEGADRSVCGAAIYNYQASPTIVNCIFRNNYARNGAAIYNYATNGKSAPFIKNCKFLKNKADFNGGAIFNNGDQGTCQVRILDSSFERNSAPYGGGIHNQGKAGVCIPVINNCVFIENYSVVRGGAVYNLQEGSGKIDPIMVSCRFENNGSTVGQDVGSTEPVQTASSGAAIELKSSGY